MILDTTSTKNKHSIKKAFNIILEQIATTHTYYDYSLSIYTGTDNKIIIICPEHGEFKQTPYCHFKRGSICPKCARNNSAEKRKTKVSEFIKNANKIHSNKYDYSITEYKNTNTKVKIICPIHGVFEQQPADHLAGHSCSKCGAANTGGVLTREQFIVNATKIHNGKYDYTKSLYTRMKFKIIITCPYHGDFTQTPSDHINGNGCQVCGGNRKRAKYFNEPTILYYLYFPSIGAYKIGITLASRGISKRFNTEKHLEYKILQSKLYETGKEAFEQEQDILKKYSEHRYSGPKFLNKGGESECFNIDVLGLNKDEDIVEPA
jgi:predicted nucleic-acid-binding Zn-ribbon protein